MSELNKCTEGDKKKEIRRSIVGIANNLEDCVLPLRKFSKLCNEISIILQELMEEDYDKEYAVTQKKHLDRDEKIALWRYYSERIKSKNDLIDLMIEDWEIMEKVKNE